MVESHVVREARPCQRIAEFAAGIAERRSQEVPRPVERFEGPEAVDDPDSEAGAQEWPIPPAPLAMLRPVAADASDVVPSVVVEDEQPAVDSQHPLCLGQLERIDAAKSRPGRYDGIGGGIGEGPAFVPAWFERIDELETGSELAKALCFPLTATNQDDIPTSDRAECIEGPRNLALTIEGCAELTRQVGIERKREIGHAGGV